MKANAFPQDLSKKSLPYRALHKAYRRWWRDPQRKRLRQRCYQLAPTPLTPPAHSDYELFMMFGTGHFEMAMWAAKSLIYYASQHFPFVFMSDGSLTDWHVNYLQKHFPGCRVIPTHEAEEAVAKVAPTYPKAVAFRPHFILSKKIIDLKLLTRSKQIGFLDADILFFEEPKSFIEALQPHTTFNTFNMEKEQSHYTLPLPKLEQALNQHVKPRINSGLWVMQAEDIRLEDWETYLNNPTIAQTDSHVHEQTYYALQVSKSPNPFRPLPSEYDVDLYKPIRGAVEKHYVGKIRHGFELEGLRYLIEEKQFIQGWNRWAGA